jgi:hypothetical protein
VGRPGRNLYVPRLRPIIASDFFAVDPLDGTKAYVLAVIEHATRRVHVLGATAHHMNAILERRIAGRRRELLGRTLIWNLPHLCRILREHETRHNTHRPRMALAGAAPDKPLPPEAVDLDAFRVHRRGRAGGVVHEYQQAA